MFSKMLRATLVAIALAAAIQQPGPAPKDPPCRPRAGCSRPKCRPGNPPPGPEAHLRPFSGNLRRSTKRFGRRRPAPGGEERGRAGRHLTETRRRAGQTQTLPIPPGPANTAPCSPAGRAKALEAQTYNPSPDLRGKPHRPGPRSKTEGNIIKGNKKARIHGRSGGGPLRAVSSPCLCGPAPRAGQFLLPPPRPLLQQGNPAAQFRQLAPPGSPPIPAVRGLHHR